MPELAYVYRGVHRHHLRLHDARRGHVIPGDLGGDMSAEEHNLLNLSDASPFTSWTHSVEVARRHCDRYGPGGVLLALPFRPPQPGDTWVWEESPDFYHEDEILLRGIRLDAEVMA